MSEAMIKRRGNLIGLAVSLALTLAAVSLPWPAAAESTQLQAQAFIRDSIDNVLVILKDRTLNRQSKLAALRRVLRRSFDHRVMGRFAAGLHYRRASLAQRERYIAVLEDFVMNTYGRRMITFSAQIDKQLKATDLFKIQDVSRVGRQDYMVRTHVKRQSLKPVTIDWRLRRRNNSFVVIDVVIMGISQIITYRSEFSAVIRRQKTGLVGLTKLLIAKNAKLAGNSR